MFNRVNTVANLSKWRKNQKQANPGLSVEHLIRHGLPQHLTVTKENPDRVATRFQAFREPVKENGSHRRIPNEQVKR